MEDLWRPSPSTGGSQPATCFRVYEHSDADARWAAHSIHVLTLEHDIISTLTLFVPPLGPRLFHAFGLPLVIPEAARAESGSTPRH
jgi:RNA polymerase sigma-70 factor, ECF subfamily